LQKKNEEQDSATSKENQLGGWNGNINENLLEVMSKMVKKNNEEVNERINKMEENARASNVIIEKKMEENNRALMNKMQEDKDEYKATLQGIAAMTARLMSLAEKN